MACWENIVPLFEEPFACDKSQAQLEIALGDATVVLKQDCAGRRSAADAALPTNLTESESRTGAVLWDGGVALARHLTAHWPAGVLSVIELGCGCAALPSIAAAQCGATELCVTDRRLEPHLSSNLSSNLSAEQMQRIRCRELDWTAAATVGEDEFDLCLAAECIYDVPLCEPLLDTMRRSCKQGGTALACWDRRIGRALAYDVFRREAARFFAEIEETELESCTLLTLRSPIKGMNAVLADARRARQARRKTRTREVALCGALLSLAERPGEALGSIEWPGARVLVSHLHACAQRGEGFERRSAVELGCGVGVCGLWLAARGGRVALTDKREMISLASRNVELNRRALERCGGHAWVEELEWGTALETRAVGVTLLLASDVVYDAELVLPFVRTVREFFARNVACELLMSYRHRDAMAETRFRQAAADEQWCIEVVEGCFPPQGRSYAVLRVRRRRSRRPNDSS